MDYTEYSDNIENLLSRISDRKLVAGVIGIGYVGLPLAVEFARTGFRTICIDVDKDKVGSVNQGISYIDGVDERDLKMYVGTGMLSATTDCSEIGQVDFIAICVPTPLDSHGRPDISHVESSVRSVARYLHKGMMVVLESTSYPGTTEEIVRPILESSGLRCCEDFYLGFSPERIDPGNRTYGIINTTKVVGGLGAAAGEVISAVYSAVLQDPDKVFRVSSPAVAEMTKMLENSFRNVNIGLINEFAIFCNKMGISIWEVIDAAKTKPFGFVPFYPGPGVGGHCIPVDPCYLNYKAGEYDFRFSMVEASVKVNESMPYYCVGRIADMLNLRYGRPLEGSRILMLGVAYKPEVDDCRESPAIRIFDMLRAAGADTMFFDHYVPEFLHHGRIHEGVKELTAELVGSVDLVVITVPHHKVDYEFVTRHAKAVFDTRNATRGVAQRSNVELL